MKIQCIADYKYGRRYVYVRNKEKREALKVLTSRKTLSNEHITALRQLGFEVEVTDPRSMLEE